MISIALLVVLVLVGLNGLNELSKVIITDKHYWVSENGVMRVKNHNLISRSRLICKI
mgnify:CR=1 FL=1